MNYSRISTYPSNDTFVDDIAEIWNHVVKVTLLQISSYSFWFYIGPVRLK